MSIFLITIFGVLIVIIGLGILGQLQNIHEQLDKLNEYQKSKQILLTKAITHGNQKH